MVSSVESAPLEYDRHRREKATRFTLTLRTGGQRVVVEATSHFEAIQTLSTLILICGHDLLVPPRNQARGNTSALTRISTPCLRVLIIF